ncbi:MAG TPA: MFS transporter [Solirubrobacteraceae bacterium]
MVSRYRSVLSVPGSARLLATALVGRLPQGMAGLAILLLVRASTHSYALAGLAVGAYTLSNALLGPVQGRLVDHFGRARVLLPSALGHGIGLVALVLAGSAHAPGLVLVVITGLAGSLMPPVAPALRALLRQVFVDPAVRESAYALDAVVQEIVWTTGPLVVAVVIAVLSPAAAVLLVGAECLAGTALFVHSPAARTALPDLAGEVRTRALANPKLRALLAPVALTGLALGATEVGLPAVALHAGSRSASGILLALWSLGSMVGGLLYGSRIWPGALRRRYQFLLLAAVVFNAPLIAARTVPMAIVGSLLAGLTIAPVFSCQYALVGRVLAPGTETEGFTWVSGALIGGAALGMAAGGVLVGAGLGVPFALSCLAMAVAAALSLRAPEPEAELEPDPEVGVAVAG